MFSWLREINKISIKQVPANKIRYCFDYIFLYLCRTLHVNKRYQFNNAINLIQPCRFVGLRRIIFKLIVALLCYVSYMVFFVHKTFQTYNLQSVLHKTELFYKHVSYKRLPNLVSVVLSLRWTYSVKTMLYELIEVDRLVSGAFFMNDIL